jgi:hypothetical protein
VASAAARNPDVFMIFLLCVAFDGWRIRCSARA